MLPLFLAGCSKGPEADLQYIERARSLAAEWAMVNEQAAKGRLTGTYVGSDAQVAPRTGANGAIDRWAMSNSRLCARKSRR